MSALTVPEELFAIIANNSDDFRKHNLTLNQCIVCMATPGFERRDHRDLKKKDEAYACLEKFRPVFDYIRVNKLPVEFPRGEKDFFSWLVAVDYFFNKSRGKSDVKLADNAGRGDPTKPCK
jgi:hypothetical protein